MQQKAKESEANTSNTALVVGEPDMLAVLLGIEAAFHTAELSCEAMIQHTDADNLLPVEIDFSDCFMLAPRSTMFANTGKCVPKLLQYINTCYGG